MEIHLNSLVVNTLLKIGQKYCDKLRIESSEMTRLQYGQRHDAKGAIITYDARKGRSQEKSTFLYLQISDKWLSYNLEGKLSRVQDLRIREKIKKY